MARNGIEQRELALSGLPTVVFSDMNGQKEYDWLALLKAGETRGTPKKNR